MCLAWLHTQDLSWEGSGWGFLGFTFWGGFFLIFNVFIYFIYCVCCLKGWELNSCTASRNRFLHVWLYLELQLGDWSV